MFKDYNDLEARIDDPALPVTADSVLVLQNAGPLGGPGMPEWGMLPIPKKLLQQGVRDMVRISDARMSGTSYGACVLHVAPESFVGGPLAFVRDGDIIELDVPARRLSLRVSDEELAPRRAGMDAARGRRIPRGYGHLYARHVTQANKGCDFDFLEGTAPIGEPEHDHRRICSALRSVKGPGDCVRGQPVRSGVRAARQRAGPGAVEMPPSTSRIWPVT